MLRKVDNASALREHEKKMKNKQNQKDLLSQLDSYTRENQKKALHDRNEDKRLMLEKLNRENEEAQSCEKIKQAWMKSCQNSQEAQMRFTQKRLAEEKKEDIEYGQSFIKSLGFNSVKDAIPKKEPKGSVMDSIFGTKIHKCHELNDRVVKSGAYEKTNTMVAQRT